MPRERTPGGEVNRRTRRPTGRVPVGRLQSGGWGPVRPGHRPPADGLPRPGARSWFEVSDARREDAAGPSYAEVYIYDEISYWGISAQMLVDQLRDLDVDEIDLHLNSPGGDVFDGIAIFQALRDHRATVTTYVDSLAASIASVIAMAGDHIVMGRMAQMMIHDAWGGCIGDAAEMRKMADELDRFSNTIAGAYAERSGTGTVNSWRKAMLAETWYDAGEAVAAGLADEVAAKRPSGDDPAPDARLARRWDLADYGFRFEGREAAPAPAAAAGGGPGDAAPPPPAPDPDPPAGDDPPEPAAVIDLPAGVDIAALFTGAVADVVKPAEIPIPGADIAALIAHEANHRPADPAVTPRDHQAPTTIDPVAFATALKEGLHS